MPFEETGNFPGKRTQSFLNESMRQTIEEIIATPMVHWGTEGYNGAFQICISRDRTWIHADEGTSWAGIVFLTPSAPPSSGTALFIHKELGIESMPKANDELPLRIKEVHHIVGRDSQDYTKWEQTDFISNRFNRLVLYRSNQFHAACNYFGDSLQDGRLIQTFFFDTEIQEKTS